MLSRQIETAGEAFKKGLHRILTNKLHAVYIYGAADRSRAVHRAHIPVGRCIALYGPDPADIYAPPSRKEIKAALHHELNYITEHLKQYPDYCVLNLCRLIYSFESVDAVISKAMASEWALGELLEWRNLMETARRSCEGRISPEEKTLMAGRVKEFFDFAVERIKTASRKWK